MVREGEQRSSICESRTIADGLDGASPVVSQEQRALILFARLVQPLRDVVLSPPGVACERPWDVEVRAGWPGGGACAVIDSGLRRPTVRRVCRGAAVPRVSADVCGRRFEPARASPAAHPFGVGAPHILVLQHLAHVVCVDEEHRHPHQERRAPLVTAAPAPLGGALGGPDRQQEEHPADHRKGDDVCDVRVAGGGGASARREDRDHYRRPTSRADQRRNGENQRRNRDA